MCLMCAGLTERVTLAERPAGKLSGLYWQGSHEDAAAGALHELLGRVKAFSDRRDTLWKSPLVAISWNDRPDHLRHFVGVELEDGEVPEAGFDNCDLPGLSYATAWHGADDGPVPDHYGRMIEWLHMRGLSWDVSRHHHREEYPPHVDLHQSTQLRLCLPVGDFKILP